MTMITLNQAHNSVITRPHGERCRVLVVALRGLHAEQADLLSDVDLLPSPEPEVSARPSTTPTTPGAGNGPFGMGWSLSIPSIKRKSDRGLPEYYEGKDSDTFILADAETLVPFREFSGGTWPDKTSTWEDDELRHLVDPMVSPARGGGATVAQIYERNRGSTGNGNGAACTYLT